MRRTMLSLVATGVIVCAPVPAGVSVELGAQAAEASKGKKRMMWDVAIDCRTWRFNTGLSFEEFRRGDSFIANGKMFPVGFLPSGAQRNDPNDPGSIGDWVERGTMAASLSEIGAGTRPAFFATWYHLLDDGRGLVADGPHPDSGPMAVTGGTGAFRSAGGELDAEIIGTNITGCPNLRLTVRIRNHESR
jgi:hypothetical protein